MSSSHVARLMTRERRADDRILEDGGTPRDGWFPRRVERHPLSSPITMKARGVRKDKAHDPALLARDLRRDRVGARLVGGPCPFPSSSSCLEVQSVLPSSGSIGIVEERRNYLVVDEFEDDDETPCSPRRSARQATGFVAALLDGEPIWPSSVGSSSLRHGNPQFAAPHDLVKPCAARVVAMDMNPRNL